LGIITPQRVREVFKPLNQIRAILDGKGHKVRFNVWMLYGQNLKPVIVSLNGLGSPTDSAERAKKVPLTGANAGQLDLINGVEKTKGQMRTAVFKVGTNRAIIRNPKGRNVCLNPSSHFKRSFVSIAITGEAITKSLKRKIRIEIVKGFIGRSRLLKARK